MKSAGNRIQSRKVSPRPLRNFHQAMQPLFDNYAKVQPVEQPMHYWLRPIKGVHFGFANFASHFIRVQIFQIDFPLILSASKYFRYISLSFYICRGQNEHFSIKSVRKKGRVELYQIFHPSNWCTDICKTQFATFKP